MKITIEIDETKRDDSYMAYTIWPDKHIILYDSKNKLMIDGTYSNHIIECDDDERPLKTIFELSDILEVKHCPKSVFKELRP